MAAALDDVALVQDQDAVAIDHAREPVCEDQRGSASHEPVERLLDHGLVLGVDGGQCLVQHEQRRVAQERAGDRHALTLPARELHALLSDHGAIALWQCQNELVDVRGLGRGLDLALARSGIAEPNVLLDGAMEQERILVHQRDHRADLREGKRAEVVPAEPDRAGLGIVEPEQQSHDRGFPAAGAADDADALAGADAEIEPVMHGSARAGIAEAHRLEGNAGLESARERRRRRVCHHGTAVEDLINSLSRGHAHHALVQHRAELAHGTEDLDAQHQDHQQRRQRHRAGVDAERAQRQGRRGTARDRAVGDAAGRHVVAEHPHGALEEIARLGL